MGGVGQDWAPGQDRLKQKLRGSDEGSWYGFRPLQ